MKLTAAALLAVGVTAHKTHEHNWKAHAVDHVYKKWFGGHVKDNCDNLETYKDGQYMRLLFKSMHNEGVKGLYDL